MSSVIATIEQVVHIEPHGGFPVEQLVPSHVQIDQGIALGFASVGSSFHGISLTLPSQHTTRLFAIVGGIPDLKNLWRNTELIAIPESRTQLELLAGDEWNVPGDTIALVSLAIDPTGTTPQIPVPG